MERAHFVRAEGAPQKRRKSLCFARLQGELQRYSATSTLGDSVRNRSATITMWRWLVLAVLPGFGGCATMISGRTQQIPINASPQGATVCIDGQKAGTSPMVANLSRKRPHVIVIEHEGYQPVMRALSNEVNPWIVVNFIPFFLIPGPFGLAVDAATGAVHTFNTAGFDFFLQKNDSLAAASPARVACSPQ